MNDPRVVAITDATYDDLALRADTPVLLELGATWCPPCKAMEPHLCAVAQAYAGRLRVATCDTDRNRGIAGRFGIQALPTFVVLREGKVVERVVGAMSRARLEALVQRAIA